MRIKRQEVQYFVHGRFTGVDRRDTGDDRIVTGVDRIVTGFNRSTHYGWRHVQLLRPVRSGFRAR